MLIRFSDEVQLTTGLLEGCQLGEKPAWHRGYRQGVHFLGNDHKQPSALTENRAPNNVVRIRLESRNRCSDMDFHFELEPEL